MAGESSGEAEERKLLFAIFGSAQRCRTSGQGGPSWWDSRIVAVKPRCAPNDPPILC
jgi:hypothetical protein